MTALRNLLLALATFAPVAGFAATLPTGAEFSDSVASGKANLETFDFAGAGFWRLPPGERIQWLQPALMDSQIAFNPGVDPCAPEMQRRGRSMIWISVLLQAADEAEWTRNAGALRTRIAKLDAELAAAKPMGESSDPRVAELLARFGRDQAVRGMSQEKWAEGLPPIAAKIWGLAFISRWQAIDCANTAWLKTQLAEIGWFSIPKFGAEADTAAWHLVQHADREPDFQRRMLKELEALPQGHTDAKRIGYLWDRVALADKRPQRYGTQGQCIEGVWKPMDVEDPEHLDERRKALGMEPIAEHALLNTRTGCSK